jgi:hypothetical protein
MSFARSMGFAVVQYTRLGFLANGIPEHELKQMTVMVRCVNDAPRPRGKHDVPGPRQPTRQF